MSDKVTIEVAYASETEQRVLALCVAPGCTLKAAIMQSGLLVLFPEIDLEKQAVGVFGKLKPLDSLVNEGDRIEIYRPLIIHPMEARRAKANKTLKKPSKRPR